MADPTTWTPDWELCEDGQCDFTYPNALGTVVVILQRCRTEDGNWLYMAVSSATASEEGGVALAVEYAAGKP